MTKVQKLIEKFETIGKQNQSMDTSFKGQKLEVERNHRKPTNLTN
jgi:hypothetical protein